MEFPVTPAKHATAKKYAMMTSGPAGRLLAACAATLSCPLLTNSGQLTPASDELTVNRRDTAGLFDVRLTAVLQIPSILNWRCSMRTAKLWAWLGAITLAVLSPPLSAQSIWVNQHTDKAVGLELMKPKKVL